MTKAIGGATGAASQLNHQFAERARLARLQSLHRTLITLALCNYPASAKRQEPEARRSVRPAKACRYCGYGQRIERLFWLSGQRAAGPANVALDGRQLTHWLCWRWPAGDGAGAGWHFAIVQRPLAAIRA